ncbi:MAG TPA: hypothetical protein DCR65_03245 [Gammaproteobacteria bacterium]|jgi:hypothetical protein|nr:hypothetical protein [Gammaproteobacteria bacterium]
MMNAFHARGGDDVLDLTEEIVLLAVKDDGGIAHTAGTLDFTLCIVGACLVDLNGRGRIDMDLDAIHVLSSDLTGRPYLDAVLKRLDGAEEMPVNDQLLDLSAMSGELVSLTINSLVSRGILSREERRLLWVLKTRRYPVIDGREQTEAKLRIVNLLLSEDLPSPHDSVLIGLAHAGGLLQGFLSSSEVARLEERLMKIGNLDLIARAVEHAIADEHERIAQALLTPTY